MGRIGRRPVLGAAGAGALALVLGACTEGGERLEPGIVAVHARGYFTAAWLEPVDDDASRGIELPGVRYVLDAAGSATRIPGSDAADLGLQTPEDPYGTDLLPARGEVLHVAAIASVNPAIMPVDTQPAAEYTERILLDGALVDLTTSPLDLDPPRLGGAALVVASIPEGAAPDHLVLEVSSGNRVQRMSLIDGSRISSDMETWYTQSIAVATAQNWWQHSAPGVDAPAPHLAGFVRATGVVPAVHDLPWPEEGRAVVAISLTRLPAPSVSTDTSSLELILADGSAAAPLGDAGTSLGTPGESGSLSFFQVPEDVETATARVRLALESADGTAHDLGTEEIALTFTREER